MYDTIQQLRAYLREEVEQMDTSIIARDKTPRWRVARRRLLRRRIRQCRSEIITIGQVISALQHIGS